MKAKLTDALVRKVDPPAKGYCLIWDEETTAFGLRVTAGGVKSFVVAYTTAAGKERRQTLGQYPALSVLAARRMAVEIRGRVYGGGDPLQEARDSRSKPVNPPTVRTVAEVGERYLQEYVAPRRTRDGAKNEAIYWRAILAKLPPNLSLSELTNGLVQKLHSDLSDKPTRANRAITSLCTALNQAIKWGWLSDNAARGIHKNPENARERFLTAEEIGRFNAALEAHPNRYSALAIRFLLLTGARKGETLKALWQDIDLERGLWVKPSGTVKKRRVHRVVLSEAALAVLAELRALHPNSPFVFVGASGQPLTSFKRTWNSIRRQAGLPGFRLHDLRHSHASLLAQAGADLLHIGGALGHTDPRTTQKYTHLTDHSYRPMTNLVGDFATAKT